MVPWGPLGGPTQPGAWHREPSASSKSALCSPTAEPLPSSLDLLICGLRWPDNNLRLFLEQCDRLQWQGARNNQAPRGHSGLDHQDSRCCVLPRPLHAPDAHFTCYWRSPGNPELLLALHPEPPEASACCHWPPTAWGLSEPCLRRFLPSYLHSSLFPFKTPQWFGASHVHQPVSWLHGASLCLSCPHLGPVPGHSGGSLGRFPWLCH